MVGLDRERQRAAVLSIPRDLYIEIPNYGYGRINQVDYIGERVTRVKGGGPALVSEVLSDTLGIATSHWVRFELTGFESIVDAVGGVTVNLDCPFYEPIFNLDTNLGDIHAARRQCTWTARLPTGSCEIESDIAGRTSASSWGAGRAKLRPICALPRIVCFQRSFDTD